MDHLDSPAVGTGLAGRHTAGDTAGGLSVLHHTRAAAEVHRSLPAVHRSHAVGAESCSHAEEAGYCSCAEAEDIGLDCRASEMAEDSRPASAMLAIFKTIRGRKPKPAAVGMDCPRRIAHEGVDCSRAEEDLGCSHVAGAGAGHIRPDYILLDYSRCLLRSSPGST